ncbi:hypothetical protein IW140_004646 [Coemansia sp. RSA 1813]|nr:hypothetical protein EV178_004719 [Coemansia sp. RSA 1646]KAJ1770157.1 hypothetical protein LPJ74_003444 [Coemansia sp. RSA 1843]KAJ2087632.1 hypothetical protein IW138_004835 [Coemansia sp. RSA 986]KAJ2214376.1 hypothetical protein EV179_003041 [Coemansia sp. RSA 487]KAJ2567079.1 hypothetical protein IW140_004646 [Coemansia sp. RSA 1813]
MNKKQSKLQSSKSFAVINIRALPNITTTTTATTTTAQQTSNGYSNNGNIAPTSPEEAEEEEEEGEEEATCTMENDRSYRENTSNKPRTMHGAGIWQTHEPSVKTINGTHGAIVHRGVLTSTIFQEPLDGDSDSGSMDHLPVYQRPAAMRSKSGVAPSVASSTGASSGRSVTAGWFSNGRTRGSAKGKSVKPPVAGESAITPFNLDATIPKVSNLSKLPSGTGATKASVTVHVHYPVDDAWRQVVFPPGVSVGQARDICMLKFNVWRRIMEREQLPSSHCPADNSKDGSGKSKRRDGSNGSGEATFNSASSSNGAAGMARDQYGLYWPERAQWLDAMALLSAYGLAADDVVELQDARAFVCTSNRSKVRRTANASSTTVATSSTVIEPRKAEPEESLLRLMQPSQQKSRGSSGSSALERKLSMISAAADAEGRLHYLQGTGIATAWKAFWVELHGSVLVCFKKQPQVSATAALVAAAARPKPMLAIDLSRGFRVVVGGPPLSDTSSVSTGTLSSTSSLSIAAPSSTGISDASLLGTVAASHKQLGASSVPLIIKCGAAKGQVHVFCAQGAADHEYWLCALARAQNPQPVQQKPKHSSRARTASQASVLSLPRSVRMVARQEVFHLARSPSPESEQPEQPLQQQPQQQPQPQQLQLQPPVSASSTASSSSLVHRRMASRDGRSAGHVVLRPRRGNSSSDNGEAMYSSTADHAAVGVAGTRMAPDDLASIERDLCGISIRRSRSFVSTLSRVDWPLPPSSAPPLPADHGRAAVDQDPLEDSHHPSLDAVGLRAESNQSSSSTRGARAPLSIRFPWFRRNHPPDP